MQYVAVYKMCITKWAHFSKFQILELDRPIWLQDELQYHKEHKNVCHMLGLIAFLGYQLHNPVIISSFCSIVDQISDLIASFL